MGVSGLDTYMRQHAQRKRVFLKFTEAHEPRALVVDGYALVHSFPACRQDWVLGGDYSAREWHLIPSLNDACAVVFLYERCSGCARGADELGAVRHAVSEMVRMFRRANIVLHVIFDCGSPPHKSETAKDRTRTRMKDLQ
jgi:hypothetical protein